MKDRIQKEKRLLELPDVCLCDQRVLKKKSNNMPFQLYHADVHYDAHHE